MKHLLKIIPLLYVISILNLACPVFAQGPFGMLFSGQENAGGVAFCSGTELFCADFETDSMITWTSTPGAEDCDGFDADGDWCDYYATSPLLGSYSLGIRGTTPITKTFTESSEYYFEATYKISDPTSTSIVQIRDIAGTSTICFLTADASDLLTVSCSNGAASYNTTLTLLANTSYHLGLYVKFETGSANNDGIVRVWSNTTGNAFIAGDLILNRNGDANTGVVTAGMWRVSSPSGIIKYIDNSKVVQGAPTWTY
jgi:hypothetical protein